MLVQHCINVMQMFCVNWDSRHIFDELLQILMLPLTEGEIEFPVISHDYAGVLKPESMVTVYLKGTVSETGRTYAHVESFHIKRPGLSIQVRFCRGIHYQLGMNNSIHPSGEFKNPFQVVRNY